MPPLKICLNPYGLAAHYGNPGIFVSVAVQAERAGFHQFVLTDHVVMGEKTETYPYGPWPTPPDFPWWEPMTTLAVVAGATNSIRLSQGILISPLRSAALLAKQAATLDQLSGGRLDMGVGYGWQKEEYDACGVPFKTRRRYFFEQIEVMKRLWRESPVNYRGEFINLESIYCDPKPVLPDGLPIYLGVAPTKSNLPRIVQLADGWLPIDVDVRIYGPSITILKAALQDNHRDPEKFVFRARFDSVRDSSGRPLLKETFEQVPKLAEAGLTHVEFYPFEFLQSKSPTELDDLLFSCGELIAEYS